MGAHDTCTVQGCTCPCDGCVSAERPYCANACHDTCCIRHIHCECATTHSERHDMPTLTAPVLAWYQCQVCRTKISYRKPLPPEEALQKALNHVRDVHLITYPDSLSLVLEHRPKP